MAPGVRDVENLFIPASDGCRLAARLWLPDDADRRPVPAILEYLPYRKRDATRLRDALMHPYFAARGYASLRVDLRGSGDSDGTMADEYLRQEQDDGVDAIAWIAAQPWCTGAVGMMGGSWGGFNALQVAARRPPALKAIITVVSTDDRYADDMHYMGGCLLSDTMSWGTQFFAQTARPPDPAVVGERWRAMWEERLRAIEPMVASWLRHQRRDAFWKHGSVCEDWDAIRCPVYAVGGWADGYSNAVFRLLDGLRVPRKGLIGPWGHGRPHFALPGPRIGFLQEALRWWDHWLKGAPTDIMAEPMLRVWMQESVPPRAHYDERPGRWVAESGWPSPRIKPRRFALDAGSLAERAAPARDLVICSPQTVGVAGGEWCPFGLGGVGAELPLDQRLDDGGSLVFDTEPLAERLEILGAPVAELELAADRPRAFVGARLSDVAPDGAATRVTYGVLNLTHRESHETPSPLTPGRRYRVRVPLNDIAHVFPPGHRIRFALSTAYWPIVWPAPEPVTVTLATGASTLTLPIRPPRVEDASLRPFEPVETAPPAPATVLRPPGIERTLARDIASGEAVFTIARDDGAVRLEETGTILELVKTLTYRVRDDDPTAARAEAEVTFKLARQEWTPEVRARSTLTATPSEFRLETDLDVFYQGGRIYCRSWADVVPRDLA